MLPFFREKFGNAASRTHAVGREAAAAVQGAREQIAALVGVRECEDVIFTSGATESDNLALQGTLDASEKKHVVTLVTEHSAVLETCRALEARHAASVTYVPVQTDGLVDLNALRDAIRPETCLVSVMAANNEIGVLQPLREIGRVCRDRNVLFHTDAAQAAGKIRLDVEQDMIDLMSLTAHKVYGPKGVGALFVRRRHPTLKRLKLNPIMFGGGHERGYRSGTLNVPAIAGMGEAYRLAKTEMPTDAKRVGEMRDKLLSLLRRELGDVRLNGHATHRLFGNLHVTLDGVDAESLMMRLPNLAISSGAACSTTKVEPSHVLKAIGLSDQATKYSLRIGVGRFNAPAEIESAADAISKAAKLLRSFVASR